MTQDWIRQHRCSWLPELPASWQGQDKARQGKAEENGISGGVSRDPALWQQDGRFRTLGRMLSK
jgi:hypothetical protein